MSASQLDEHSIFAIAIKIADPAAREAYLNQVCENDNDLLERVLLLISAHETDSQFLENAPAVLGQTVDVEKGKDLSGLQIGRYKLLQEIGEGGFGVVYMAEQTEPVCRKVAIKVVKPGMDSREILTRFEAERQALAMMDHPNIAKILDAGSTESGHPYFVMELVKGIPLTQYCDENHLEPKARLELFIQVCEAIQHAHQKGVIHRDIKPSNVLVAEYDDQAVPKIIDFGVAKALNQKLTEKTMFTQYGQIIGTPEYMSPEQAKFNQLDVDTRSDIYSLGVLLYELMSGETPFDRERLRSAAFEELIRIIREEDPPRPSNRLKSSATLPAIADARKLSVPKLSNLLKGDLDLIIMTSMEKDRARRYDTPRELAADVRRYLNDKPVQVTSPGFIYQIVKLYRRHRVAFTTSLLIVFVLVVSAIVSSVGWIRANNLNHQYLATIDDNDKLLKEQKRLIGEWKNAVNRADEEANRAETNRLRAEQEANNFMVINRFLNEDILVPFTPKGGANSIGNLKMSHVLTSASNKLDEYTSEGGMFAKSPDIAASLRHTLGKSFTAVGMVKMAQDQLFKAQKLIRHAHGAESLAEYRLLWDLGRAYDIKKDREVSSQYFRSAYRGMRKYLAEDDPELLDARFEYAKSLPINLDLEENREKELRDLHSDLTTSFGAEHDKTLLCQFWLGLTLRQQGQQSMGLRLMNHSLAILTSKDAIKNFDSLFALFWMAHLTENLVKRIEIYEKLIPEMRTNLGKGHPTTLNAEVNYGASLVQAKKYQAAINHLKEVIPVAESSLGFEHWNTGMMYDNLGSAYRYIGENKNAFEAKKKAYLGYKGGRDYPRALKCQMDMILVCRSAADFEKAFRVLNDFVDEWQLEGQKADAGTFKWSVNAINNLFGSGKIVEAEQLARELIAMHERAPEGAKQEFAWVHGLLGKILVRQGRFDEATPFAKKSAELCRKINTEDQWLYYVADPLVGECLARGNSDPAGITMGLEGLYGVTKFSQDWSNQRAAFMPLLRASHEVKESRKLIFDFCKKTLAEKNQTTAQTVNHGINALLELGESSNAEILARELIELHEENNFNDPLRRAWALALLANAMMDQNRPDEAEVYIKEFRRVQNTCSHSAQGHWYWPTSLLGKCKLQQANFIEAETLLLEALEGTFRFNADVNAKSRLFASLQNLYGQESAKEHVDVKTLIDLGHRLRDQKLFRTYHLQAYTLELLVRTRHYELAVEYAYDLIEYQKAEKANDAWQMRWTYGNLAEALIRSGKFKEANETLKKVQLYHSAFFTEWSPLGQWPKYLRGIWYLEQGEFSKAEPLLLQGLKAERQCTDGKFYTRQVEKQYVQSLVQLYERWEEAEPENGHSAQVAKWKKELPRY